MPDMPSRFIEILDAGDGYPKISDSDVKLEDVLADHEATVNRSRSSTQSSVKSSLEKDRSEKNDHPTQSYPRLRKLRKFTLTGR
jgi:hypothetical protein